MLEAPGAAASAARAPLKGTLLLSAGTLDSFYDADSLVFSRAPGERQYYQFASWTERPARRIAQLAQVRLEARGGFAAVASLTSGVAGDLVLNLAVADFYHDATASPGTVRVALVAELVDIRTRRLLGRRTFTASAAVGTDDARGAVQAFDRATAEALDALAPWVETTAAAAAR
ncbi:MAG: ABC-type transport auxiliary lipoprotein family protein [Burkholderiales bacterium]|nr:ABC-type transport auxiliary lipoprotein family protein [Burkholderiales bacterium]